MIKSAAVKHCDLTDEQIFWFRCGSSGSYCNLFVIGGTASCFPYLGRFAMCVKQRKSKKILPTSPQWNGLIPPVVQLYTRMFLDLQQDGESQQWTLRLLQLHINMSVFKPVHPLRSREPSCRQSGVYNHIYWYQVCHGVIRCSHRTQDSLSSLEQRNTSTLQDCNNNSFLKKIEVCDCQIFKWLNGWSKDCRNQNVGNSINTGPVKRSLSWRVFPSNRFQCLLTSSV